MFDSVNEPSFRLDIAGLSDPLEVLAFSGSEGISEPFAFEIDLLINDPQLDLSSLLYRSAFLQFGPQQNGLNGQLHSLVQQELGHGARLCRARLGPKLSCLGLRFSQRMFSGYSVPQILVRVLKEHGIRGAQRRLDLRGDYPPQMFCTQYRESDLQFVQRLCEQARIHYYFEHGRDGHCLVFSDDPAQWPKAGVAQLDSVGEQPAVRRWQVALDARAGSSAQGQTDVPTLRSGQWLAMLGQPAAERDSHWLLNRVEHCADTSREPAYSNHICGTKTPQSTPARALGRPRMHSLQRAWVVAVSEPQPDQSRPVAVQFDWLYQGEGAAASHCWLPLAPALADNPQITLQEGVEVVVSFLEGDPDQPVISGILQEAAIDVDADDAPGLPENLASAGFEQWLKSDEPLLLLCLIPGGGSYNRCTQPVCSCRMLAALDQSGAR
ncbi:type VI secretion system Vgr family protein [Pseudomonas sp. HMWF021]|uniref:type VI secretion system Vgr family protein n=1 Tax=Pseudomonas sp. HMWF021 TaxID=2056857 RepID=UPI000D370916|nr:contractile injection system protein, VgrG/Pvc8 family [Pseudomonas sp. HMWF021]PTT27516.1 type VI secretion protein [Pseudomonas sp. HMWF021]